MDGDHVEMPDFLCAAECVNIFGNEIGHLIEPLRERQGRTGKRLDKRRADAVALGVPLVLLRDRAADAVEAGIKRMVAVERAYQEAKGSFADENAVSPD